MATDYRALCIELFGTDDANKIKQIANERSSRNAGRKKKYSEHDVKIMREMREHGATINQIATRFGTSRQIISKYLTAKPKRGYTMRLTYMYNQLPCTNIDVDFLDRHIIIENFTDDILQRAFGTKANPNWEDFEDFMEFRCFPKSRGNVNDILNDLQLDSYDPIQIIERTRGRTTDDNMWLKIKYFKREGILYGNN